MRLYIDSFSFTCSITCLDILEFSKLKTWVEADRIKWLLNECSVTQYLVCNGTYCTIMVRVGYLLGSEHVSKHRKQTSITDPKTHTVLSQNLESTQQVKNLSHPSIRLHIRSVDSCCYRLHCAVRWRNFLCEACRWVHQIAAGSKPGGPGRYSRAARDQPRSASAAGWEHQHADSLRLAVGHTLIGCLHHHFIHVIIYFKTDLK